MTTDNLEVNPDHVWPLHEQLAQIAYELEKDPVYADTAQELWAILVTLSKVLQGVVEDALEEDEDEDDFVDYGDLPD